MRLEDFHDPADWCEWCGKKLPQDVYWGRRKFCSEHCRETIRWRARGQTRSEFMAAMAAKRCGHCGGPINRRRPNALYCSDDCCQAYFKGLRAKALAEERAKLTCQVCGKSLRHLHKSNARYCSKSCQQKAYKARRRAASAQRLDQSPTEKHLCSRSLGTGHYPNKD